MTKKKPVDGGPDPAVRALDVLSSMGSREHRERP